MKRIIFLALVIGSFGLVGCSNPSTPAGYVGYVTQGAWFGHDRFYNMQTGPTSTGLGWLLDAHNISVTPYTYHEPMTVLSKDNLKVSFQVHIVWRVKPEHEQVKLFVEKYTTLERGDDKNPNKVVEVAYGNFLKEPLRTATRDEVQALDALALKERIVQIGHAIEKTMKIWVNNTPFDIMSVVVGDIQYPDEVANAVAKKMATTQLLEQKATEIQIAGRDAEKRIKDAEGVAKAMEIINQRLTPQYLQHEAIAAQEKMVGSPNHTTIYIPVGNNGVPLVGTFDASGKPTK
ncbi:MAG: hypothetical protein HYV51_01700 [Parcubacteria group bacterium]|nr:hypothetical protein [Parcubacteria group bacterium]